MVHTTNCTFIEKSPGSELKFCLEQSEIIENSATMIRRGKQDGWLNLPSNALRPWAELNGVSFDGVNVGQIPGSPDKGCGVVAAKNLKGGDGGLLMVIPRDLVLSLKGVELQAKADKHLRELLDALGDYARVGQYFLL